jgi:hypothetical protein
MQSCVWMEEQNNSIFDLFNDHQILFLKSQRKTSLVCATRTFSLSVLIDNKSVSFLIKCPMPVIERLWRRCKQSSYPRKERRKRVNMKQKKRHTMLETSLRFLPFTMPKYAFCLTRKHSKFSALIPYVFTEKKKRENLTSELSCQRINDSTKRVKFLSGNRERRNTKFAKIQKVLIYLKCL